ncbi:MAG TPA: YdiU family protein [Vitreimonas sp.]|uniref:protein adenylyltransferase SelO family protein n=1 Tax=Vitreimonas sp. TaxID=3069702 RepID=UPI002D6BD685|nr:YdiU family protein [Vitreimonas sp.]HYD88668.1 YdiU family protein [Vitreimonas sp.]
MPVSASYRPDPLFEKLGPEFADPVAPARFPEHILRRRNQAWAERLGLGELSAEEWTAHFARFEPLPDNMRQPLAMRYHGHQFRSYNPEIGDGRGFLHAQLRDDAGRLLDFGTKGSGQTPYSRFGDGRLTLKGGVREILAAEMLEALSVNTSKAFSLYETGEQLVRGDEPSPTRSSVLVRLSHSHIRFGTFQRLAFFERPDLAHQLIEHVCAAYYPQHLGLAGEARAAAMYGEIVEASARLAASWMGAGFVHGVLNTDNLNVTGESFDYGPWRFLPTSDPSFTAAYFDETGLYAFGRQPEAVSWALSQLGGALTLACAPALLEAELARFAPASQRGLRGYLFGRLKLTEGDLGADISFLSDMFSWLTESQAGWDQFFHDWHCGAASAERARQSPQAALYAADAFAPVRAGFEARTRGNAAALLAHPYYQQPQPVSMVIEEVERVWAAIAERDDWGPFEAKLRDIATLKAALSGCHASVAEG